MTALFASKTQLTSGPEIVVEKTYKDTLEEAIHFLCSEVCLVFTITCHNIPPGKTTKKGLTWAW
jgi:hypothetical protein